MQSLQLRSLQIKESRFIRKNALKTLGVNPMKVFYYFVGQIEIFISLFLFNIKLRLKRDFINNK